MLWRDARLLDNIKTRLERRLNTFSVRNEPREVHLAYSKSKKRSPLVIIELQRSYTCVVWRRAFPDSSAETSSGKADTLFDLPFVAAKFALVVRYILGASSR
jgi:hypothetical protein